MPSLRTVAFAVIVLAGALRFAALDRRPMHAEEAQLASRLGLGPDLSESIVRSAPAAAGMLLVVIPLLFAAELGVPAAVLGAAFIALSPGLVYYSRFLSLDTFAAFGIALAIWPAKRLRRIVASALERRTPIILIVLLGAGGWMLRRSWPEALIVILAMIGAVRSPAARVFALLGAITALLPLETRASTVHSMWPLAIAAGAALPFRLASAAVAIPLVIGAVAVSLVYPTDPKNPYASGQTPPSIHRLAASLRRYPRDTRVQVIAPSKLWPMPWYLRRFSRVEWLADVPFDTPVAPIVIATADLEPALTFRLYDVPREEDQQTYNYLTTGEVFILPGVEIRAYIAQRLVK